MCDVRIQIRRFCGGLVFGSGLNRHTYSFHHEDLHGERMCVGAMANMEGLRTYTVVWWFWFLVEGFCRSHGLEASYRRKKSFLRISPDLGEVRAVWLSALLRTYSAGRKTQRVHCLALGRDGELAEDR